jgi:DNA-directed RNA polymerase II subunit RPB1
MQFLYGEDGMGGEHIEDQKITILEKSDRDMKASFQLIDPNKDVVDELLRLKEILEPSVVEQIADNMEMQVMLQKNYDEMVRYRNELRKDVFKPNDDKQHLPVNIERLITTAKRKFNLDNAKLSDLNPCTVIEET